MTITFRGVKGVDLTHPELDANFTDLSHRMGWEDHNDAATAINPIALTTPDVLYPLTNDGAGPFTNTTYKIPNHGDIWDPNTNTFNYADLSLGDTVELRVDLTVTTTGPAREITTVLNLAIGSPGPYTLLIDQRAFKSAGTYNVIALATGYIGDTNTQNFPMKINMASDAVGTTVVVNGWYIKIHTR